MVQDVNCWEQAGVTVRARHLQMTVDNWPELYSCPPRRLRQLRQDPKCWRHHLRREFQLQHLPSINFESLGWVLCKAPYRS